MSYFYRTKMHPDSPLGTTHLFINDD